MTYFKHRGCFTISFRVNMTACQNKITKVAHINLPTLTQITAATEGNKPKTPCNNNMKQRQMRISGNEKKKSKKHLRSVKLPSFKLKYEITITETQVNPKVPLNVILFLQYFTQRNT